jgi:hypothetical protein
MEKLVGIIALIGLLASLVVHGLSIAHVDVEYYFPAVWALWGGCVISYSQARRERAAPPLDSKTPRWHRAVLTCAALYGCLGFLFMIFFSEGYVVQHGGSTFDLVNDSKVMRELAEEEAHVRRADELQAFSGLWIAFYLYPALHLLRRRSASPASEHRTERSAD